LILFSFFIRKLGENDGANDGENPALKSKCPIPAKRAQNARFPQNALKMPDLSKNFSKCRI
jgi:hypothetical protein